MTHSDKKPERDQGRVRGGRSGKLDIAVTVEEFGDVWPGGKKNLLVAPNSQGIVTERKRVLV